MCRSVREPTALTEAIVSRHEEVAAHTWRMELHAGSWPGRDPDPGQFLMLRVSDGTDPLLARPFGISGFQRRDAGAVLEIIYRVVGRGTRVMGLWRQGREVRFLGPVGKGFALPPEGSSSLLVAGGVGLPPLLALARRMRDLGRSRELVLLYGEASRERLVPLPGEVVPDVETATCTEDGTCGTRGLVTGLVEAREAGRGRHVFVCGPNPMMSAVLKITQDRCLSSQFSLEARMACGFGVCSGCAVKVASGHYARVCRDGPVFDGRDLSDESFRAA